MYELSLYLYFNLLDINKYSDVLTQVRHTTSDRCDLLCGCPRQHRSRTPWCSNSQTRQREAEVASWAEHFETSENFFTWVKHDLFQNCQLLGCTDLFMLLFTHFDSDVRCCKTKYLLSWKLISWNCFSTCILILHCVRL